MKTRILQNAVRVISEDKIYVSRHTHDFVSFVTPDGENGFIDGGLDYIRAGGAAFGEHKDIEPLFIVVNENINDDDMDLIANRAVWGTRGKDGKEPLKYIKLKDATTEHLEAILRTQPIGGKWIEKAIRHILKERKKSKKHFLHE